ncbi:hypothetical protein HPB48_000635 [Haemaphysalis longicornis]|uniref:Fibronectin type-III domain-containing protein n=1 Tax=Haemaphysalis longicornis TaxID=44386 RepID=A0A9J6FQ07_HAELO|nr:hypothetical protein HPB48_000635 [Haemaphysalis longicornis]
MAILEMQSPSSMVLWRKTRDNRNATVWVDGSHMTLSSHSLPVCELLPCGTYAVHIRSCLADACSDATTTVFKTSPSSIPTPFITTIFSNDTSSIHMEWSFRRPIERPDLDPQFEVRVGTNGIFEIIKTTGMALTVTDLSAGTEYEVEVRQSLKVAPELRKYGNPARAVVRTWPKDDELVVGGVVAGVAVPFVEMPGKPEDERFAATGRSGKEDL